MSQTKAEIESKVLDLTSEAFDCFAEDIEMMFDTKVHAQQMDFGEGTVSDLKDNFKKLAAVINVKSEGRLYGKYHVIFDREGLFTMAGTFVMQPEKVIEQNRKAGTEAEASEIGDAIGEVGNLMVGSWDRIFREDFEGHGHFVQCGTFVGNPWSDTQGSIGVAKDEEVVMVQYEMTVEPLEPFRCAAIYPKKLFEYVAPEEQKSESAEAAPAAEESAPAEAPAGEAPAAPAPEMTPQGDQQVEQVAAAAPAPEAAPQPAPAQAAPAPAAQMPADAAQQPVSDAIRMMTQTGMLPQQGGPAEALVLSGVQANQLMRTDIAWASPEETVEQLVAKMQQFDTGYLLVGQEGRLEGIVSKSDIRGAMSPYLQSMFVKWRGPMDVASLQIKAKWVMSRPVRTVTPQASVSNIMKTMLNHGGRCMPVVDKNGAVLGMITAFDVFRTLLNGPENNTAGRTQQNPPLA